MMELIWAKLPQLLDGAWLTVQISAIAIAAGLGLAVPLAMLRVSRRRLLSWPIYAFTFFFRGTPLLVQLFLIYYGSGQFRDTLAAAGLWGLFSQAFFCGALTLSLNTAAYMTEIMRGAIQGVPAGEIEAARACGMRGALLYRRIILPKAFRIAWPAYINEIVFLIQATSLVSIITLVDLTGAAQAVATRNYAFYEMYLAAAAMYLVMIYSVLMICKRVEHRLTAHVGGSRRRRRFGLETRG